MKRPCLPPLCGFAPAPQAYSRGMVGLATTRHLSRATGDLRVALGAQGPPTNSASRKAVEHEKLTNRAHSRRISRAKRRQCGQGAAARAARSGLLVRGCLFMQARCAEIRA